jgi:glycerophosphoryl diester phosphodiesterase
VVLLLFCLCGAWAAGDAPALDIQGHRGCRGLFPENTLPAFEHALELRVTTLELDLQVTRDRVLVVHHDPRLNGKLCNRADGRSVEATPIRELLVEDLAEIDCGTRRAPGFPEQKTVPGARIPRLDQVLALAHDAAYPVRLSVEIKAQEKNDRVSSAEFAELLVGQLREHGLSERTIVQSFSVEALQAVREIAPDLERALLIRKRGRYDAAFAESGATILSPKHTALRREDVQRFREQGVPVIPWTVNAPEDIRRLVEWGVDGIISDYPDRVIEIAREASAE